MIFLFTSSYVGYIVQNHNETVKEIVFVYRFFFIIISLEPFIDFVVIWLCLFCFLFADTEWCRTTSSRAIR